MSAPTKFCVDCKHHTLLVGTERCGFLRLRERTVTEHVCGGFRKDTVDPVTGRTSSEYEEIPCAVARNNPHVCGPEAKRWEPRA
jgi:hypothetical protein